jgi:hypothetical protein
LNISHQNLPAFFGHPADTGLMSITDSGMIPISKLHLINLANVTRTRVELQRPLRTRDR